MEKRRISPVCHNIFNMSLTSGVKLIVHLLNVVVRFIVFLTSSATLIFRGTDISKCLSDSLGIRDNESRLYLNRLVSVMFYAVVLSYVAFVLSFFVPHLSFWYLGKVVFQYCGVFWLFSLIFFTFFLIPFVLV